MLRHAHNINLLKSLISALALLWGFSFFSACTQPRGKDVDGLNEMSYAQHYRSLEATEKYASIALKSAKDYSAGKAEAYNNLAFVAMARMRYHEADSLLDLASGQTNNQVERLIADVQHMRLCQRRSQNADFYRYKEAAGRKIARIDEERRLLTPHLEGRYYYALTEKNIIESTYYYYVGLMDQCSEAIVSLAKRNLMPPEFATDVLTGANDTIIAPKDTAQYLAYIYACGSGGVVRGATPDVISITEAQALDRCYVRAVSFKSPFWRGQAMQAMSEAIMDKGADIRAYFEEYGLVDTLFVPDEESALHFAKESLREFQRYGDVYQIAGAYRTVASCFFAREEYDSADCYLDLALHKDTLIYQAPDLVASIYEQKSMVCAALGDPQGCDKARKWYLDKRKTTRRDEQWQATVRRLTEESNALSAMVYMILVLLFLTVVIVLWLYYHYKRKDASGIVEKLLLPLKEWDAERKKDGQRQAEDLEQTLEEAASLRLNIQTLKRRNVETRAKVFLVNSLLPLIIRMRNEVERLKDLSAASGMSTDRGWNVNQPNANDRQISERKQYIRELAAKIVETNDVITHWIKVQGGRISLLIETFDLSDVFQLVALGRSSFALKGVDLEVRSTKMRVKADKTLTLFMINTLADNARKFTPEGGKVTIYAREDEAGCVEISVRDTGEGLDEEQRANIFSHTVEHGHGFGLMNCRSIIDQYHKLSSLFSSCRLSVESEKGKGSRFSFTLPKAVRLLLALVSLSITLSCGSSMRKNAVSTESPIERLTPKHLTADLKEAERYIALAAKANRDTLFEKALSYGDTAMYCLNCHYKSIVPKGECLINMEADYGGDVPEMVWWREGLKMPYKSIVRLRGEMAVAALKLCDWALYRANNHANEVLYKESNANTGLEGTSRALEKTKFNQRVSIVVLCLLLLVIVVSYYAFYYRTVIRYKFAIERIKAVNAVLREGSLSLEDKLAKVLSLRRKRLPKELSAVAGNMENSLREALESSLLFEQKRMEASDLAHSLSFKRGSLYVSCCLLDNSLSALKHETMYYPSRIGVLMEQERIDVDTVLEVTAYYQALYEALLRRFKAQIAMVKTETRSVSLAPYGGDVRVLGDEEMVDYLFLLLRQAALDRQIKTSISTLSDRLVGLQAKMSYDFKDCDCAIGRQCDVFSAKESHIPFLIMRQIVRQMSDATMIAALGITAHRAAKDILEVNITLAKARS